MTPAPATLPLLFLLFLLWLQNVDRSSSSLTGFQPPQIDGSAVDVCQNFFERGASSTPAAATAAATARSTTKRMLTTRGTRKPTVQSPERSLESRVSRAPIRTQPAAGGPIGSRRSDIIRRLLSRLLAGSGGHASSPRPMGAQRRHHRVSSNSNKRQTWIASSSSSEDSSDES